MSKRQIDRLFLSWRRLLAANETRPVALVVAKGPTLTPEHWVLNWSGQMEDNNALALLNRVETDCLDRKAAGR